MLISNLKYNKNT